MGRGQKTSLKKKSIVSWKFSCQRAAVLLVAAVIIMGCLPYQAEAVTVQLNRSKVTVYIGKSTTLKIKGTKKKVRWISSNKKIAVISKDGRVTGKKPGKVIITAKINSKKYTCTVLVKRPQLSCNEKTLRVGQSFSLKMKGASVKEWTSSDESILTVNREGKVTAKQVGNGIITCRTKNEKFYPCMVTVKKSKKHVHEYTSEITLSPTCSSEGVESFVCSCGDSYSRNISATGMHQYKTVVTQPHCGTYGYTTYYCKDCGYSYQSDFVLPLGHDMEEQVVHEVDEAHCMEYDKTYDVCKRCGYTYFLGGAGVEKHDFTSVVIPPTETEQGYTLYTCSNCGKEVKGDYTD